MAGSIGALVRDLRRYAGSKALVRELGREFRKPVPVVRQAIRARAVAILPHRGGLGKWVSRTRVTAQIRLSGRRAGVKLKGTRKSLRAKSDVKRIDRGRVRAPSWGHRTKTSWHTQTVRSGFFTGPAAETDAWRAACVAAVDRATEVIRRG
jgi:hypothetical protein